MKLFLCIFLIAFVLFAGVGIWWLQPGWPFRALAGDHIIIDTFRNRLHLFQNGDIIEFEVATGKQPGMTPTGEFTIVTKEVLNPPQTNPQLGTRWLGLRVPEAQDGLKYGIHGTDEPSSIGKNVSSGCIRMHNRDVEKLFNRVKVGFPVIVRPIPFPVNLIYTYLDTDD